MDATRILRWLTVGVCVISACYESVDDEPVAEEGDRAGGGWQVYATYGGGSGGSFTTGGNNDGDKAEVVVDEFAQSPEAAAALPNSAYAQWHAGSENWAKVALNAWCEDHPPAPGACQAICQQANKNWKGTVRGYGADVLVLEGPDEFVGIATQTDPVTLLDSNVTCTAQQPCLTGEIEVDEESSPAPRCICDCA